MWHIRKSMMNLCMWTITSSFLRCLRAWLFDVLYKSPSVCVCVQDWVVLGQVDVDALVEKHLHSVQDWERNFRALKARGKESERLPRYLCVISCTVCLRACVAFNAVCVCVQHREGRLHHGELWTCQSGCGRSHPEAVWRSADVLEEVHPGCDHNTHYTALMVFKDNMCTLTSAVIVN